MRLIDADAILKVYSRDDFFIGGDDIIKTAPTIEAIPIEWLMEKSRELSSDAMFIYEGMSRSEKEKATHSGRYKETITESVETFLTEWHMRQHLASLVGEWKEEQKNEDTGKLDG